MKLLVDFSQLIISSVTADPSLMKSDDPENMIRHIVLNQLLSLRRRFSKSDVILCCDSKTYWRRDEFEWYKGHRKHAKNDGSIDWDLVYRMVASLKEELFMHFNYIVLEVEGAEADDIIAVLTKFFQTHELVQTGLIEEADKIVVSSTDGDFVQLQKFLNVRQWNNVTKSFMVSKNPKHSLIEKIVYGDTGDNIPNILTGDWWAQARSDGVKTRAKPFASARLQSFLEKGSTACLNEEELRNYKRNEKYIDFDLIPHKITDKIINTYETYETRGSKQEIFSYLMSHRMKLLLGDYQSF